MTDWRVTETYRKDTHHEPGHGYGRNIGTRDKPKWTAWRAKAPSTLVVHTTNNPNKGTKVWNEATFIRDSPDVSCADLIGKDGTIYVILPAGMQAWHAGVAVPAFLNEHSIGIELHCSVGETPTQTQKDALAWRVQQYIKTYSLDAAAIQTHRKIALPAGRKSDPEGWSDAEFYAWRSMLFNGPNWELLWGPHYPYFPESGIAQRWRAEHLVTPLGQACTDEYSDAIGRTWRTFQHGAVWWWQGTTGVWR
jgi:hypothetical protein